MRKRKTIEAFEMAFIIVLSVAIFAGLGKLIFDLKYLAIEIIILSVPVSHLIFKYKPSILGLKFPDLLLIILFLNVLCCLAIMSSNGRHTAYIEKLFLGGKVIHGKALTEDDRGIEYYDTFYGLKTENETGASIIGWTLFFVCIGVLVISYRYVTIAQKILPEKNTNLKSTFLKEK